MKSTKAATTTTTTTTSKLSSSFWVDDHRRFMTTTTTSTTTTTTGANDADELQKNTKKNEEEPKSVLLYSAPMGGLITRLKVVSITSCVMSIVGLPMLVYLKNGSWPNMQQLGLGGVAFMGATGSTLALHFVFGPYILELYQIPVPAVAEEEDSSTTTTTTADDDDDGNVVAALPNGPEYMFQATTRSVFGWKKQHIFDPLTDVTTYAGMRPFANFVIHGTTTLYAHPEIMDESTRLMLLHPKTTTTATTATTTTGSAGTATKTTHDKTKKANDDDDLF